MGKHISVQKKVWDKVNKNGPIPESRPNLEPCWIWTASLSCGYGQLTTYRDGKQKHQWAHRVVYVLVRGSIPKGLTLDHLCRVTKCVNPDHLEPVTMEVNLLRGTSPPAMNARKTHCIHNHELTAENVYIAHGYKRHCMRCKRLRNYAYTVRKFEASLGVSR